ncbi:MAG TPA: hypothetical protein VMH02_12030 [Verrucomicrobiae bacterium]|nr:hypothetical protein [Verrucomicrobiae bacterium]
MNYDAIALWSQMAGCVLFIVALIWTWNKYITPSAASAQKASNERIALLERHREEMKAALDVLRRQVDDARSDAEAIEARAGEQADRETAAALAEAREEGERALQSAAGELERARAAARVRLHDELAAETLNIARSEAAGRVDASVNARLVDGFLASLERGARN